MSAFATMQAQPTQLPGRPSRYSPPQPTNGTQPTIQNRNSVQLYRANSTNVSPTSIFQQPNSANQPSPGGPPNGALNPFMVNYAPPRQIHTPKSPMYRPAVLRTTERPSRPSTANGATKESSSPNSINSESSDKPSSGLGIFSGAELFSNVFGTTNLGSVPEWEEHLNKLVTGLPNRLHWKVYNSWLLRSLLG